MNQSILIRLLRKFSSKEIKEFGEFVHSPFFNKNESVIKLYEFIRKQYPGFDEKKLKKELVYAKIFPMVKYNDGFMRTLMFNLAELAQTYLAFTKYRQNQFTEKKYLLQEMNERELDREIKRKLKEITKEFDSIKVHDADYYYERFMIEFEYFYFLNRTNLDRTEKFISDSHVENMFNHLTYFYLFYAIRHYVYFLNQRSLYSVDFRTDLIEDIFRNLKPEYFQGVPAISLYYDILMLFLKEDDTSYFYRVKKQVRENEDKLNRFQITGAYINLENYCKRMIRKGNVNFVRELFEIYKIKIDRKFYAFKKEMSAKFYRGVVDAGIRLKELAWTKEFIEKYKNELTAGSRESTYLYCLALYEFALKNFERSLELISTVKFTEIYHKTELKCLTTKLYYELALDDLFHSNIDSFRHFLSNDGLIPAERKKYYSNFIKYAKSINGLRGTREKDELNILLQKVRDDSAVYNKEWIIDKIEAERM